MNFVKKYLSVVLLAFLCGSVACGMGQGLSEGYELQLLSPLPNNDHDSSELDLSAYGLGFLSSSSSLLSSSLPLLSSTVFEPGMDDEAGLDLDENTTTDVTPEFYPPASAVILPPLSLLSSSSSLQEMVNKGSRGVVEKLACLQPGCSKKFDSHYGLTQHMATHTKPFKCTYEGCGEAFARKSHLIQHEGTHTPGHAKKSHKCIVCNKSFTQDSGLNEHYKTDTHQRKVKEKAAELSSSSSQLYQPDFVVGHLLSSSSSSSVLDQSGSMVGYSLSLLSSSMLGDLEAAAVLYQKKCERDETLEDNDEEVQESTQQQVSVKHKKRKKVIKKKWECSFPGCGKKCICKSHLEDHIRTHTREMPFKCVICNQPFARKKSVTQHMRTHTQSSSLLSIDDPEVAANLVMSRLGWSQASTQQATVPESNAATKMAAEEDK